MTDAFFEPLGEGRYRATELTRGPWDPQAQHAGPPAALLGGAVEAALEGPAVRITFEILRPVAITDLHVTAEVVRPGRQVRLAEGTLSDERGPVILARAWTIRHEDVPLPEHVLVHPDTVAPPEDAEVKPFFATGQDVGWHSAMDIRFLHGGFTEPGAALVWMRTRVPIVAGHEPTPLQRVLVAADGGNGVSAVLDAPAWLFINTDLTVHLHRQPAGEWVSLDAHTALERHGVGLAQAVLRDERGVLGRSLQSLLVAEG